MDNIIVAYQPFTMGQKIFVYKDGAVVDTIEVPLESANDTILGLAKKYSIHNVTLTGNQDYLRKFEAELRTRFENNDFSVKILTK